MFPMLLSWGAILQLYPSTDRHLRFHVHIVLKLKTLTRLSNNYSCLALDTFLKSMN